MSALNHSVEVDMSAVWRAIALNFARDLAAERAKLRRWQLRMRWRLEHRVESRIGIYDRLYLRSRVPAMPCRLMATWHRGTPIAGPRGVLP